MAETTPVPLPVSEPVEGRVEPVSAATAEALVAEASRVDRGPRKIFSRAPVYPEAARRSGEQGVVVVEAQVDATGQVTGAAVIQGSQALGRAAAEALHGWRFEPAMKNGEPVAAPYRVRFRFELQPSAPLEVGGDVEAPRGLQAPS